MKISRTIAIALVGLSIGLGATSASAGILGDIVGKVGNKVGERILGVKPVKKGGGDFWGCIAYLTNGGKNAVTPAISSTCKKNAEG